MKKTDLIWLILSGPLAVYLIYVTFTESWTRTDNILMIILLAGSLIVPQILEKIRKRIHDKNTANGKNKSN